MPLFQNNTIMSYVLFSTFDYVYLFHIVEFRLDLSLTLRVKGSRVTNRLIFEGAISQIFPRICCYF